MSDLTSDLELALRSGRRGRRDQPAAVRSRRSAGHRETGPDPGVGRRPGRRAGDPVDAGRRAAGRRDRGGGVRRSDRRPAARGRRWVLDPIDGTKNFVRGVPVWATLIALFDGDDAVVGVVSAPALARRWWAAAGLGAFTRFGGREPAAMPGVRGCASWPTRRCPIPNWRNGGRPACADEFAALCRACWRTRAYGDFYSYMLVAEGAVDIAAEPELSLWDVAALIPIVTEAGGRLTAIDGQPSGGTVRQRAGHERPAARPGVDAAEQVNRPPARPQLTRSDRVGSTRDRPSSQLSVRWSDHITHNDECVYTPSL